MKNNKLIIPCLKGKVGDGDEAWFFYTGLMSYKDIAERVKLPKEIDARYKDSQLKLGEWIQRKLAPERTNRIVEYINNQPQRFFNSLILGIFDGSPYWQEINVTKNIENIQDFDEDVYKYFSETMGVLTLEGDENIFAIDGQHRAIGIREAVKENNSVLLDEIPVIFVAHKMTEEGIVRTRRLFSTLNRYAKPVDKSEIIALSEDDNCAILTRNIIDKFDLFKNKILVNKSPSISLSNVESFTNIRTLYYIVERYFTDNKVFNFKVSGKNYYDFTNIRLKESELEILYTEITSFLKTNLNLIPSFKLFIKIGKIDRNSMSTNLIFRPIGINIFFDVLKVSKEFNKEKLAIKYFQKDTFNLDNKVWLNILWDTDSNNITTQKTRVKYATLLILEHIGVPIHKTKKDNELFNSFNLDPKSI
jgi:DNA sulfur modification protein DndB